jgi:hypothetical protein
MELPHEDLSWQAREVVREVDHEPHLLVRLAVAGGYFPQRALVPIMRIVQGDEIVAHSWITEISADNRTLLGYFPTDLPEEGVIEFGYPDQPLGRLRVELGGDAIRRLDRHRVDERVVEASSDYIRRKRGY